MASQKNKKEIIALLSEISLTKLVVKSTDVYGMMMEVKSLALCC